MTMTVYNITEALRRKEIGIAQCSDNNQEFLRAARTIAWVIARNQGSVTADDVRKECEGRGIVPSHYNAWGGVFRHRAFRWTGKTQLSTAVQGHGNPIKIWEIR